MPLYLVLALWAAVLPTSLLQPALPLLEDIAQAGIDMGMNETAKLLSTKVKRGRLTADNGSHLNKITPTLSYDGIDQANLIVEAVVENPVIKKNVLVRSNH